MTPKTIIRNLSNCAPEHRADLVRTLGFAEFFTLIDKLEQACLIQYEITSSTCTFKYRPRIIDIWGMSISDTITERLYFAFGEMVAQFEKQDFEFILEKL